MRVVIVGATGNVGTSLIRSCAHEKAVESIVGLARRVPEISLPKTTWAQADVTTSDLVAHFKGADAVVHLAWLIQPSRDIVKLRNTNVNGSRRVFEAAASARVPALIYASSVGTYSPGPKDEAVDESWPARGVSTSFYSRHKAEVEAMLDTFEQEHPDVRVVRIRPGLIFKREAASEIRRLFIGPLLPSFLVRQSLVPVVPNIEGLRFQAVHSYDVGDAYRLATVSEARGVFNVAAEPVLDPHELARLFNARLVRVSPQLVRRLAQIAWRLRLQPTPAGWADMGFNVPIMNTARARKELGWSPRYSATEALQDLLEGLRQNAGLETPPLHPRAGGVLRMREFLTGIGSRS
jgi:UDP-glucose 4-epimerase